MLKYGGAPGLFSTKKKSRDSTDFATMASLEGKNYSPLALKKSALVNQSYNFTPGT